MDHRVMRQSAPNPESDQKLLRDHDPEPVCVVNADGASRYVITCEHAGREIPSQLGDLGIDDDDRNRHIAWDIGAAETAGHLSRILDAPLVMQTFSRLVIDCNRPVNADDSIPEVSDGRAIPGNEGLSMEQRAVRESEIHRPYHASVESLLSARAHRHEEPVLISFHTFTRALEVDGVFRPWDMGLLYNRDDRLAGLFDRVLCEMDHDYKIAHNEPYSVCDESDYTLPVHGESRGIHNLLLEVRNDHVADGRGHRMWGEFLGAALKAVERKIGDVE